MLATREYQRSYEPLPGHIAFAGPPQDNCLIVPGDSTAPISPVIYAYLDDEDTIDAGPSLGTLFELWTEQLEHGDFKFTGDRWQSLDGPPPFVRNP